ncbi:MAG: hypothetical protein CMF12_13845 [Idiomarina sp.]|uniref:Uncharacterized protein n=1 Tax=Idiomarina aquatica TaxID=1327752 RepID=A0A4R6PJF5_9GAMM|nr:hypothetical protein [Idiomarina sp.]TDP38247.1 hypothetical protein DEU29_10599 [Idiomarina aquatica]
MDAATRGFEALFEKVSGAMDGASQAPQGWVHGRLSQTGFKYPSRIPPPDLLHRLIIIRHQTILSHCFRAISLRFNYNTAQF